MATCERKLGHGEDSTYLKLSSDANTGVSEVLVERLATLIKSMQGRGKVVLSSTWRKPRHVARVAKLEEAIASALGAPFQFHGRTEIREDNTPGLRLETIGNYVSKYCEEHPPKKDLRVLALEDFHVGAVGKWTCGETVVESISEAEQYLEGRAPAHVRISARVVHTYDEFVTADGLQVQIGCGLTCEHLCRAHAFLGVACEFCSNVKSSKSDGNYWQGHENQMPFPRDDANQSPTSNFGTDQVAWANQSPMVKQSTPMAPTPVCAHNGCHSQ